MNVDVDHLDAAHLDSSSAFSIKQIRTFGCAHDPLVGHRFLRTKDADASPQTMATHTAAQAR